MRISVGQRVVSEIWDKSLEQGRRTLYLPAFPLVEWLVTNWWTLFNELCPAESIPRGDLRRREWFWTTRHCLRAADSSLMLPALYLYHDGRSLRAEWHRDVPDSVPHWPGEFIAEDAADLDFDQTFESLSNFINDTLVKVRRLNDSRVQGVASTWRAIQATDPEEGSFCTLAGRLGLDPYFDGLPESLVSLLETLATDAPLVRDLTELAQPDAFVEQWQWISATIDQLALDGAPRARAIESPAHSAVPSEFGYALARMVRDNAGYDYSAPIASVEQLASHSAGQEVRFVERNHVPGEGIKAVVAHASQGDVIIAGPPPPRQDSRRFLLARGLYHALVNQGHTQRLITSAHSWDQKASRAFAAELLAPRAALQSRITTDEVDDDTVDDLGHYFRVSSLLIRRQLSNAGISVAL